MRSSWFLGAAAAAALIAGCGGEDDEGERQPARAPTAPKVLTEDAVPAGFTTTPTVKVNGREWTFDNVPGHYWKVLNEDGFAAGLHFETQGKPFKWSKDARPGELLYMVYAIPGHCRGGSVQRAVKAKDATIMGPTMPGFDHWHGLVEAKTKVGHWLIHIPVRDFALAGPPGNPMDGTPVKAGAPGFMPVCDIR